MNYLDRTESLQSIVDDIHTFEFISDEMKNDKEFILEAIKLIPFIVQFISEELRNDFYAYHKLHYESIRELPK